VSAAPPLPQALREYLVGALAAMVLADLRERPSLAEGGTSQQARAVKSYVTLAQGKRSKNPLRFTPLYPPEEVKP
jgi:hypothetical protein